MFLIKNLHPNKVLHDRKNKVYHVIARIVPGSGFVYLVSFTSSNQISLPEQYSINNIIEKINGGEIELLDHNPLLKSEKVYSNLSVAEKRLVERIAPKIESIVHSERFYGKDRFKYIEEQSIIHPTVSVPTILKGIRKYFFGGQCRASLAGNWKNCGAKGKVKSFRKITQEQIDLITMGFDKYYLHSERTADDARIETIHNHWNPELHGSEYFDTETFRRYGKKAFPDAYENKVKRLGIKKAKSNHRLLSERATSLSLGPGSLFQIDWKQMNIGIVASFNRNLYIGKPKIYCVVDVSSRLIVGILITMENPSWETFMQAVFYAAMDKVKLTKYFDYDLNAGDWLGECLPQKFIADGEAANIKANMLGQNLGVTLAIVESYRGELKGVVEKVNDLINERIAAELDGSGKMVNKYGRRIGIDGRFEACLTLKELYCIAFDVVLYLNSRTLKYLPHHEDLVKHLVDKTPNDIWLWGQKYGFSFPQSRPEEQLFQDLFNPKWIVPNKLGFTIESQNFTPIHECDRTLLQDLINRPNGAGYQPVVYDPCLFRNKFWIYEGRRIPLRKLGLDEVECENIWELKTLNDHYNARADHNSLKEDNLKIKYKRKAKSIIKKSKENQSGTNEKVRITNDSAIKTIESSINYRVLSSAELHSSGETSKLPNENQFHVNDFDVYSDDQELIDQMMLASIKNV